MAGAGLPPWYVGPAVPTTPGLPASYQSPHSLSVSLSLTFNSPQGGQGPFFFNFGTYNDSKDMRRRKSRSRSRNRDAPLAAGPAPAHLNHLPAAVPPGAMGRPVEHDSDHEHGEVAERASPVMAHAEEAAAGEDVTVLGAVLAVVASPALVAPADLPAGADALGHGLRALVQTQKTHLKSYKVDLTRVCMIHTVITYTT